MPIEFEITLTQKDMYRFNMYQLYSGFQGWFSVIASVILFAASALRHEELGGTKTVLCVMAGIVVLVYPPFSMILRSKQRFMSTEALRQALHYAVGEKGIAVRQGEASGELPWEQIYKVAATKSNVLVYSNRMNAYVIPREQLGEHYQAFAALVKEKLPKYRVKIK